MRQLEGARPIDLRRSFWLDIAVDTCPSVTNFFFDGRCSLIRLMANTRNGLLRGT